jgi:hypothetical protein
VQHCFAKLVASKRLIGIDPVCEIQTNVDSGISLDYDLLRGQLLAIASSSAASKAIILTL